MPCISLSVCVPFLPLIRNVEDHILKLIFCNLFVTDLLLVLKVPLYPK